MNLVIQQFLRNYVTAYQQNWVDHLELVEFCYNSSEHSTMGATPFQMVTGKSLIVPTTWVGQPPSDASDASDASEEVPKVTQLDEEKQRLWEMAKANLEKAHKRYKDFVDKSQLEMKFQKRDEVWLNIKNFRLPKGLSHKFLGPFKVLEKKLFNTYKLELPENLRLHPTFHVSLLKPIAHDASKPNREHNSRPPLDLVHNEP